MLSDACGNSSVAPGFLHSGQITKSMFDSGAYSVFTVNLKRCADESVDSLAKSMTVNFRIEGGLTSYDLVYVLTYETELVVDRSSGEILPA